MHGIHVIPKLEYSATDMALLCADPSQVPDVLADARLALGLEGDAPLCVKPAADGCSFGVARIESETDLFVYASAVTEEWEEIPSDLLSGEGLELKGRGSGLMVAIPIGGSRACHAGVGR